MYVLGAFSKRTAVDAWDALKYLDRLKTSEAQLDLVTAIFTQRNVSVRGPERGRRGDTRMAGGTFFFFFFFFFMTP